MRSAISLFISLFLIVSVQNALGQWVKTANLSNETVYGLAYHQNNLFTGTFGAGIFRSGDNGATWTGTNSGLLGTQVWSIVTDGTNLYAACNTIGGINKSTDTGQNWIQIFSGLEMMETLHCFELSGNDLYSGGNLKVYRSIDYGLNWIEIGNLGVGVSAWDLLVFNGFLFAEAHPWGVYRSPLNTWQFTQINNGLPSNEVRKLASIGQNLFVGVKFGGVYKSSNNGDTWTQVNNGLTNLQVTSIASNGTDLFAGTQFAGVFLSRDNGSNWTDFGQGISDQGLAVNSFLFTATHIFIGTDHGVWYRPLSDVATSVPSENGVPTKFELMQNYPNPFNPATIITFSIPQEAYVTLKIFSVLGKEVAALIDRRMNAGTHQVEWKPAGLSSGVYFYRIETSNFIETKKLVLLK